jgi:hypothetical protein
MPDQAAALAIVASPSTIASAADRTGTEPATDAGARVIPLDTRRRRPSADAVAASRAVHPAQLWAERMARTPLTMPLVALATPS